MNSKYVNDKIKMQKLLNILAQWAKLNTTESHRSKNPAMAQYRMEKI